jgi:pimeloyl-ACP methyl ester carboxylesterase
VSELRALTNGAEIRTTNGMRDRMVICVNGGQGTEVPGTWSATLEWLVKRFAPSFPQLGFVELRYRVKSWRQLGLCIEDARAALEEARGQQTLFVGFSMGGAVAISAADDSSVVGVLGLAPWIFDRLGLAPLSGKRLDVLHGSLDRSLPGIPGVSATLSRRGFQRAQSLGIAGSYTLVRGGVHGLALRAPGGTLFPLPRAGLWARLIEERLRLFAS